MVNCPPKALSSRLIAQGDETFGADNGDAVQATRSPEEAIHYAVYASQLADERGQLYLRLGVTKELKSPRKAYFPGEDSSHKMVQAWSKFANYGSSLLLGHPDFTVFPHEILGDQVVDPLKEAWKDFRPAYEELKKTEIYRNRVEDPGLWREVVQDTMATTGYLDAREEAKQTLDDLYGDGQDPERWQYGQAWLNRVAPDRSVLAKSLEYFTKNVVENSVKYNPLLIYRHFFDQMRVADTYGWKAYLRGIQNFKTGNPEEIKRINPRQNLIAPGEGFDPLHQVAKWNQGVTYFAAKAEAIRNGMGLTDAEAYGKAAVEHIQFQTSPVDQPRAFWQGGSLLALSKFHLLERRWYLGMWKNLAQGVKDIKTENGQTLFKESARALLNYNIGHAVIFGLSSTLPAENEYLEAIYPHYAALLKKIDKFSVSGSLFNLDIAPYTRSPLTMAGVIPRLGLVFNTLQSGVEKIQEAVNHPKNLHSLVLAVNSGLMVLPSGLGIPVLRNIGNAEIGHFNDWMARAFTNDYTHRTIHGKKYELTPFEEFTRFLRGGKDSLDTDIQKAQLDAGENDSVSGY